MPRLVVSDKKGNIFIHPDLKMLGFDGKSIRPALSQELITMPKGGKFFFMPGRLALGLDERSKDVVALAAFEGRRVYPLSAFLVPGFTRLLHPAARLIDSGPTLPLWAYTAVGYLKGRFVVSAIKIDSRNRQRPSYYKDRALLARRVRSLLKKLNKNRLIGHLSNCALNYNCLAAKNFFFKRWEAPLPISPTCNAKCLGCLSLQDPGSACASHSRIDLALTAQEVEEAAFVHISNAKEAIVSFGQGCEGEPLLRFELLKKTILGIRKKTSQGTIHLNTNAYSPDKIKELAKAGLDSIRVSINSLDPRSYASYFNPRGYSLKDVVSSIKAAQENGLFVAINLLAFPGATDSQEEVSRLSAFLKKGYVNMVQWRNLCIDPDHFLDKMPRVRLKPLGMFNMIKYIRRKNPRLIHGYFNLPKERFRSGYSAV